MQVGAAPVLPFPAPLPIQQATRASTTTTTAAPDIAAILAGIMASQSAAAAMPGKTPGEPIGQNENAAPAVHMQPDAPLNAQLPSSLPPPPISMPFVDAQLADFLRMAASSGNHAMPGAPPIPCKPPLSRSHF